MVHGIADREMKLHRAARKLDELRPDAATDAAISVLTTDLCSSLDAISQLKYRAIEAKQKTKHEIEQREEETARPVRPVKLPQLPVLPSTVEELKQKIALHNVSSVLWL